MRQEADDCIWVRTNVMLGSGGLPAACVETRQLCRNGVFLEYTGALADEAVEIVFPEPYSDSDGHHLLGTVTQRWPDGIWVRFRDNSLSSVEILMRAGPPLMESAHHHV